MNVALWASQIILALIFGTAGYMKATQPQERLLRQGVNWAERVHLSLVRIIGIAELLGAVGLVLPTALNILPILTPLAAIGLAVIMVFASIHHVQYKEWNAILFNLALLAMAVFIVYGRL
ncbi:MAG TPA: DoxX family protein [Chitinophagaceae bacterium]|nr:DoxX family protein [Chitinophagaceae bacterium]